MTNATKTATYCMPYFVVNTRGTGGELRGVFPFKVDADAMADAIGGTVMTWHEAGSAVNKALGGSWAEQVQRAHMFRTIAGLVER